MNRYWESQNKNLHFLVVYCKCGHRKSSNSLEHLLKIIFARNCLLTVLMPYFC